MFCDTIYIILTMKEIMKIARTTLVLAIVATLLGCSKTTKDVTQSFTLPPGLADCKVHHMRGDSDADYLRIIVVRCPNSSTTTTTSGKNPISTTVVE